MDKQLVFSSVVTGKSLSPDDASSSPVEHRYNFQLFWVKAQRMPVLSLTPVEDKDVWAQSGGAAAAPSPSPPPHAVRVITPAEIATLELHDSILTITCTDSAGVLELCVPSSGALAVVAGTKGGGAGAGAGAGARPVPPRTGPGSAHTQQGGSTGVASLSHWRKIARRIVTDTIRHWEESAEGGGGGCEEGGEGEGGAPTAPHGPPTAGAAAAAAAGLQVTMTVHRLGLALGGSRPAPSLQGHDSACTLLTRHGGVGGGVARGHGARGEGQDDRENGSGKGNHLPHTFSTGSATTVTTSSAAEGSPSLHPAFSDLDLSFPAGVQSPMGGYGTPQAGGERARGISATQHQQAASSVPQQPPPGSSSGGGGGSSRRQGGVEGSTNERPRLVIPPPHHHHQQQQQQQGGSGVYSQSAGVRVVPPLPSSSGGGGGSVLRATYSVPAMLGHGQGQGRGRWARGQAAHQHHHPHGQHGMLPHTHSAPQMMYAGGGGGGGGGALYLPQAYPPSAHATTHGGGGAGSGQTAWASMGGAQGRQSGGPGEGASTRPALSIDYGGPLTSFQLSPTSLPVRLAQGALSPLSTPTHGAGQGLGEGFTSAHGGRAGPPPGLPLLPGGTPPHPHYASSLAYAPLPAATSAPAYGGGQQPAQGGGKWR